MEPSVSTNKSLGPYSDRLMSLLNNTSLFRSLGPDEAFSLLTSTAIHVADSLTPAQKRGFACYFDCESKGCRVGCSVEKPLADLVSTNGAEGYHAAVVLDGQRAQLVKRLLAVCNSTNSFPVKEFAVVVLGQYRASEAVPFLVQHLEWDDSIEGDMTFPAGFPRNSVEINAAVSPVFSALVSIGVPAISAVLDKIAQTDDLKIIKRCVQVCRAVEGPEVTRFRLEGRVEKVTEQHRGSV